MMISGKDNALWRIYRSVNIFRFDPPALCFKFTSLNIHVSENGTQDNYRCQYDNDSRKA